MATDPSQSDIIITPFVSPVPATGAKRLEARDARGHEPSDEWLNGEVVGCACPDCGAPMSIVMWLRIAECVRCATSIELTEELIQDLQRRAAARSPSAAASPTAQASPNAATALPQRAATATAQAASPAAAPAGAPTPPTTLPTPPPAPPPPPADASDQRPAPEPKKPAEESGRRVAAAAQPGRIRKKIHSMAEQGTVYVWWRELWRDLPAWLISAVLHLAALLILAMMVIAAEPPEEPYITLSTELSSNKREGGETVSLPSDEVEFDLPVDPNDLPPTKEARLKLAQDARELRLDENTIIPNAQSIEALKAAVKSNDPDRRALAVRDPRVRAEVVAKEGGTTLTEAAVTRGLRWMAQHQNSNGSWSLHAFHRAGSCNGRCSGPGMRSDTGGTALALLPFLGAGQTHLMGNYQSEVAAALRYLISIQKEDGDLRGNSEGISQMYAHGQASLVLCEAYKMTGDERFRAPAQKAINFIVNAQHLGGGWRYLPAYEDRKQHPDTSVLGWQILALHSAKQAYLEVPDSALQLAGFYLDKAQATVVVTERGRKRVIGQDGGLYCYEPTRDKSFKRSMSAEGLLCRMMLGWKLDHPGLQEGVGYLTDYHLPEKGERDLYYWYYGTQMFHHVGGKAWTKWNLRIRDLLVQLQEKSGHQAGSWPSNIDAQHGSRGGRLYTTAFATAILEVYYRHAPLFRQIDLE